MDSDEEGLDIQTVVDRGRASVRLIDFSGTLGVGTI